jgi:hypothetical protein
MMPTGAPTFSGCRRDAKLRRIVCGQCQCRKQILENGDVPPSGWHLRGHRRIGCRRQRVVFARGQKRAVLAMAGVGDPLAAQRMPSEVCVGRAVARAARTGGRQTARNRVASVEQQRAAITLGQPELVHFAITTHRSSTGRSRSTPLVRAASCPRVAAAISWMGIFGVRSAYSSPLAS